MTGLILAGVEPIVAVRYQIVVMYMLLAAASVSAIVARTCPGVHCSTRPTAIPGAGSLINAQVGIPTAALVFVDHDVNAMVIGERRAGSFTWTTCCSSGGDRCPEPASSPQGRPARAQGTAGDIGHIRADVRPKIRRCAARGQSGASRHTRVVGRSCATCRRGHDVGSVDDVVLQLQKVIP